MSSIMITEVTIYIKYFRFEIQRRKSVDFAYIIPGYYGDWNTDENPLFMDIPEDR